MTEEMNTHLDENTAKWYVIHTYSAYENKVKDKIQMMIDNKSAQNVYEVMVPMEEYVGKKSNGQEEVKERKLFPGYVLVKMNITPTSWYLIRNTKGVTGFVGPGSEPVPLTEKEIRTFGVKKEISYEELGVNVGDEVKIITGLFADMPAKVEEINVEKRTIKGIVSMFGRDTSVELGFDGIEKLD